MATVYSDIFDLFLQSVQDYNIDNLIVSSTPLAETFMTGFLVKAIPNFQGCLKDLDDRNDSTKTFNITLDSNEKVILSNLMVVEWWQRQIHDIRQISLHINVAEAKHYAESQNLKEKVVAMLAVQDLVERQITKYQYGNLDLGQWT